MTEWGNSMYVDELAKVIRNRNATETRPRLAKLKIDSKIYADGEVDGVYSAELVL